MRINREMLALTAVVCACMLWAVFMRVRPHGDGATYYLMTTSLVFDGDTRLDERDIARWNRAPFQNVPAGAYAVERGDKLFFAKPLLYPLVAAPFFLLFGAAGFSVLNGLCLGGCVALSCIFLRRRLSFRTALLAAAVFFGCSFLPAYVFWIHPEMLLAFACTLCVWFMLSGRQASAAFLIGMGSCIKPFFLLLLLPQIPSYLRQRRFSAILRDVLLCAFGAVLIHALTVWLGSPVSPYSGINGYIPAIRGFWENVGQIRAARVLLPSPLIGFEYAGPLLYALEAFYFFAGRFTGFFWYCFPAAVCIFAYLLRRRTCSPDERAWGDGVLVAFAVLAAALIVFLPLNYFGGKDFMGNRYFFLLPAFFFLPVWPSAGMGRRVTAWFIPGALVSLALVYSEATFSGKWEERAAAHTRLFPLVLAPVETVDAEYLLLYEYPLPGGRCYSTTALRMDAGRISSRRGADVVFVYKSGHTPVMKCGGRRIDPYFTLGKDKVFYSIRVKAGMAVELSEGR